ncbi:hypothetical protein [Aeromicrobium sp. Leaf291]|uniref:hypothetical protein n=1 Tax=Aeromicrobium sp. Leaf291 TaxID=1736325 RepID=UPI000AEBF95C|nr:hypothetical protein [Aeromicrobium sp. Leaf291]
MATTAPLTARFLLATPKRCTTCQRTVFAVDQLGACPGCQRRTFRPAVLEETHP